MSTCLLFRSLFAQDFFCAVLTSSEIPDFVISPAWGLVGTLVAGTVPALRRLQAREALQREGHVLVDAKGSQIARAVQNSPLRRARRTRSRAAAEA